MSYLHGTMCLSGFVQVQAQSRKQQLRRLRISELSFKYVNNNFGSLSVEKEVKFGAKEMPDTHAGN